MYIGENDQRIRMVTPAGIISTFYQGLGGRVRLSSAGNLFVDAWRIEPSGHGYQLAFSGGTSTGIGDGGPATAATGSPGLQDAGVAIDAEGNLYLSDMSNRRIRAIRFGAVLAEPGSTVTATAGDGQQANEDTPFSTALQVTLQSPAGTPENGIRVDFAAPSSGPSCVFPNGSNLVSVLTGSDGTASVICIANTQTGSFIVTATPLALGSDASFSLTNLSAPAAPIAIFSSGSLSFGSELAGSTTSAQTVTLTNFGGAPMNIASLATSGDFSQTNTCATSLSVSSSCTISITFAPIAGGARSGALSVADNAAGSPQVVTLNGIGSTVSLSSSATSLSVNPGATTGNTSTITVTPSGGFTGTVSLSCAISPTAASDPATCSLSLASVAISGATQTSTLTVSTTAATTCSSMVDPGSFGGKHPGAPWYVAGSTTLACLLLFGIPARQRSWRIMLGMLALLVALTSGVCACGGGGSAGGGGGGGGGGGNNCTSNSGTTAGTYTITITGASGTITATNTVTLTVQ
jgi:hypothetical protein